jgi:NADH dehydrogenase FAD-containing subunit
MRVEGYQNIFAVGDIAEKNVPMGYYAIEQAKYLTNYFEKGIRQKKKVKDYPAVTKPASIVSIGPKAGVAQLPLTKKGVVFGSTTACAIKAKDLYTQANWDHLGFDRKTKNPKKEVADKKKNHAITLAAAMQITADEAESIRAGNLPELKERDDYKA